MMNEISTFVIKARVVPVGPVVKTPCFHYRGHGFDPWSGN